MSAPKEIEESRASAPFHIMVKPIGPKCNLDCTYCFYLEKEVLFGDGERWKMDDATLESYVRRYIEAQPADPVTFAWQGGEPTLCGVDFFEKVVKWQKQYGKGRQIDNAFQTNGTLLDDEWGAFLKRENFLVGLSIDGPAEVHDALRVKRSGAGSHAEVMKGLEFLKKHRVDFNTLTCVNRANQDKGAEVYAFLKGIGSRYMQFIPIIERLPDAEAKKLGLSHATPPKFAEEDENLDAPVTDWSVQPKAYGRFMWSMFKRWVQHDVGKIYVQLFDVALGKWAGVPGGLCVYSEECGRAMALEHDGSLYSCDHYVYPEFKIGNINEQSMAEMADSPQQKAFGKAKRETLPKFCIECDFRFTCNGGCPKHRFLLTPEDDPGLNYLCSGYRFIFGKMDPYMKAMAELYRNGQPPAAVMQLIKEKRLPKPA
ncbi:anaerobic sulfatase maturase [Puniceicoccales bacterium CK1056]|uniref:Anaerobic sulfatase maturase n=1 Tax=Oceanipulchritudo coccoides TaxID=2706888 RepID=A0A6B2M6Z1_9BACT|nr:anaerobic sulfatase maturase [Oceanipulchritudo coccoides]NDV63585.1 anaerobic sulfatase maturase [Oceanipulchritudo coccoides]